MSLRLPSVLSLFAASVVASLPSARAQDIPRPRITGLSHVAWYVHDMGKTLEFYKNFLGFDQPYSLMNKDGTPHLIWIKINDRQTIELFPEKEAGAGQLYHIAFETDDAEGMRQYLASKGIEVPPKTPVGKSGNANYFVKDPDGHFVEIVQHRPDGWTMKDVGQHMPATRISTHMSHAGIKVRNLEASLKFYRDILGFKEFWRGSSNGRQLSWVNLRVPDGQDYLELMLYGSLPSEERMHSMNHLCLEVPNVAQAGEILAGRTLPPECRPPTPMKTGVNRKRQINYFDPDGTRIEIMEATTVDGKPAPSSDAPPPQFHP